MTNAEAERAVMKTMFQTYAVVRTLDPDPRGEAAADSLRRIAETIGSIDDATVEKLMQVNDVSEGMLRKLISARMQQIGLALPCYPDARQFFAPIIAEVDDILANARRKMC